MYTNYTVCIAVLLAVIEHVRDACTVRAFLLPDFIYVTLMLSGVKVSLSDCMYICLAVHAWIVCVV